MCRTIITRVLRLGSVAYIDPARYPLRVHHHHAGIAPTPLCLQLPPAGGLDCDQLLRPEIDDGDVFQPPSLRRGAGVIVKQPDAAQSSLENLPVQEFRLAVAIHFQTETYFWI